MKIIGHIEVLTAGICGQRLIIGDGERALQLQVPDDIYATHKGISHHRDDYFLCEYSPETIRTEYTIFAGVVTKLEPYVWPEIVWPQPEPEVKHECTIFSPPKMEETYWQNAEWKENH